jgi:hypothetical protein
VKENGAFGCYRLHRSSFAPEIRNQKIADLLFLDPVSIANSHGKLGAGHRTAALARARELNLL